MEGDHNKEHAHKHGHEEHRSDHGHHGHHKEHHHEHHGHGHGHHHGHHRHDFSDVERWTQFFDSPDRDSYQQPELVLQRVGIKNDSISADIGGGTGYFPIKISKASPQGRVYSCDTTPQMVEHLKKRVAENNFANIIPVLAHGDDPMIPEPVDFIFMVNTYHHIEDRVNYFKKLQSKLKPNGRIVNIDWKPGQLPMGPPESTKLSPDQVTEELQQAGFKLVDQPDLPTPYHYTVVYEVSK